MTNVLHLVASSRGGGASHVRDLAAGLEQIGFGVGVAMPEDGGNVRRENLPSSIAFYPVDIAAGLSLKALRQIRHLALAADILHVHGARAALIGRLAAASPGRRRPRLVYTIHGFAAPHYPFPKRQILLSIELALAAMTDCWVCVSEAERVALLNAGVGDAHRVRVIRNGIDVERYALPAEEREHVRQSLNVPPGALLITTVCRLYRPRDFDTLLQAFQRVRTTFSRALLWIVGEGPLRVEIEGQVRRLGLQGQVRLLGMRHDVPQLLAATDVFVLSSRGWEGLPLTVLEAMAAAQPVVASDVGGTGEAVDNGRTGFLYPPGDVDALASHIQKLADDAGLAREMGRRGQTRVRQSFTAARMVQETAALYAELLGRGLTG